MLNSVEINLASFRNDLAIVSADIESLQARSTALNRRLENRQNVEKALSPLVEELSLSPEVISKIAEGHIDETWTKMLAELDRRSTASKKRSDTRQIKAADDLGPLLEKLTLKVWRKLILTVSCAHKPRQLNVFAIFLLHKSRLSDHLTSTRKSYNNKISSASKISTYSSTNTTLPWPPKSHKPI